MKWSTALLLTIVSMATTGISGQYRYPKEIEGYWIMMISSYLAQACPFSLKEVGEYVGLKTSPVFFMEIEERSGKFYHHDNYCNGSKTEILIKDVGPIKTGKLGTVFNPVANAEVEVSAYPDDKGLHYELYDIDHDRLIKENYSVYKHIHGLLINEISSSYLHCRLYYYQVDYHPCSIFKAGTRFS